jgi:membrane protease YdiL (CAAX protease family)
MSDGKTAYKGLWKGFRHPLVRLVVEFALLFAAMAALQIAAGIVVGQDQPGPVQVAVSLIVNTLLLLAYAGIVRLFERRPVTELEPRWALSELPLGLLGGALLFATTVGILSLLGFYRVVSVNPWTVILPALAANIATGVIEELWFRGLLFRLVEEWLNTWWALALSALVFGLLHLLTPHATLWAGLAIALEAGILLAATYVLTRRLWLAIGVHIAWNFAQGGIFGVAVSGATASGLLNSTLTGPELLSGGAYGAEASILTVVLSLAVSGVLLYRGFVAGRYLAWRKER